MSGTAERLLTVLALLQGQPGLSARALAARAGVQERTIRNDIIRLRNLGYPILSRPGRGGGYELGVGGRIPPLLLDEEEAVAVAIGLGLLTTIPGVNTTGDRVLAKLEQTLPDRLRRRVRAVHDNLDVAPVNTATNAAAPSVDGAMLSELAIAIRDRQGLRVRYGAEATLEVDPYRLVSWQERWYLVARQRPHGDFRTLRVDWLTVRTPGTSRFADKPLAGGDYSALVLREVASTGWAVHARILIDAPADEVLARINPAVGVVEAVDVNHSVLVTGADTLETIAVWIGMLGLDFHIDAPPELVRHVSQLAARYLKATTRQGWETPR